MKILEILPVPDRTNEEAIVQIANVECPDGTTRLIGVELDRYGRDAALFDPHDESLDWWQELLRVEPDAGVQLIEAALNTPFAREEGR